MTTSTLSEVERLRAALRAAWCRETSADSRWSAEVPERGQCAVTALVVQDTLGGELVRAEVDGVSHYWNLLVNGTEIDLTRGQFESFIPTGVGLRTRNYVLSFPETKKRYELLRHRLGYA